MTDQRIQALFEDAGDFIRRELRCGAFTIYAYAIDGLISGADASQYIFRPIATHLTGATMEELYRKFLYGIIGR